MDLYEMAFGLILNAGNSKSKSMMAIEAAREFEFEEAEKLVAEAEEDLRAAGKLLAEGLKAYKAAKANA